MRRRPPTFTILSAVTALLLVCFFIALYLLDESSDPWIVVFILLRLGFVPGLALLIVFLIAALVRKESRPPKSFLWTTLATLLLLLLIAPFSPGVQRRWRNYNERRAYEEMEPKRTWGKTGSILAFAVQPDGKILIGGPGIARLLPNGARDSLFYSRDWDLLGKSYVEQIVVQPDGGILFAGPGLVRLRPNGLTDKTLHADAPYYRVQALALQQDGRIVMGGDSPQNRRLKRFLADGSGDESFVPALDTDPARHTQLSPSVTSLHIDEKGRIVVAGLFELRGKDSPYGLVRLNARGSLDESFEPRLSEDVLMIRKVNGNPPLAATGNRLTPESWFTVEPAHLRNNGLTQRWEGRPPVAVAFQGKKMLVLDGGKLVRWNTDGTPDTSFALAEIRFHR